MMTARKIDEMSIRKDVARRAKELGARVSHRDITLEFMDAEIAVGCRVFRATWRAGRAQGGLTGLLRDEEEPDTYPARSLGKLFHRWLETEGKLPNPMLVARVAAYLYDPLMVHTVILTQEDRSRYIERLEWLPYIQLPETIEIAGRPGIIFWWGGPTGASRMRLYLDQRNRIHSEEKMIQDFLGDEKPDA